MGDISYTVKTPVFEGPLDLLLDLVSKRKLFINEVSLAAVTDDFIRYIEEHEDFPIGESAEFILIASTLMLIKSRSLLPLLQLSEEEEQSIEELEDRLALHARTKELALEIKKVFGKEIIFEKNPVKSDVVIFSPDSKTDVDHLAQSLEMVLEALPKTETLPKAAVRKMISLEETITALSERIAKDIKMNFKEAYKGQDKVTVIIGFLAMLELVKRGAIRVSQEGRGDIELETTDITVPNYA